MVSTFGNDFKRRELYIYSSYKKEKQKKKNRRE